MRQRVNGSIYPLGSVIREQGEGSGDQEDKRHFRGGKYTLIARGLFHIP